MTVVQPNAQTKSQVRIISPAVIINGSLILVFGVMAFLYVIWANGAASYDYQSTQLREELVRLTDTNSALLSQKNSTEDPASAVEFAHNQGMVEAKDVVYVFENGNVALRK